MALLLVAWQIVVILDFWEVAQGDSLAVVGWLAKHYYHAAVV
jgi:hypothetical protein